MCPRWTGSSQCTSLPQVPLQGHGAPKYAPKEAPKKSANFFKPIELPPSPSSSSRQAGAVLDLANSRQVEGSARYEWFGSSLAYLHDGILAVGSPTWTDGSVRSRLGPFNLGWLELPLKVASY